REHLSFVDQVGQAVGSCFLVDLLARVFAFQGQQFFHPITARPYLFRRQDVGQEQVAVSIQRLFFPWRQRVLAHAERIESLLNVHVLPLCWLAGRLRALPLHSLLDNDTYKLSALRFPAVAAKLLANRNLLPRSRKVFCTPIQAWGQEVR